MIRTLFLDKLDHERLRKTGINPKVREAVNAVSRVLAVQSERDLELRQSFERASFRVDTSPNHPSMVGPRLSPIGSRTNRKGGGRQLLRARLADAEAVAAGWRSQLDESERRAADYLLVTREGFSAYLGSLFAAGFG